MFFCLGEKRLRELREKRAQMEKGDKPPVETNPYQIARNKIELEFSKSPGSKQNPKEKSSPEPKKLPNTQNAQPKKTAVDPKAAIQLVEGLDMKKINMLMDSEGEESPCN